MGNICAKICDVMSWIRIPFTFGQIEEEEQEEQESTQDAVQSDLEVETDQEVHHSRELSTRTRKILGHYTKYNGLVSSIQLLIVIVVVMSVVTLSFDVPKRKDHFSLQVVQISFMVTGLAIMISIFKCQGRFLRGENEPKERKKERDNLVLIGIVTFCALSCLHSFFGVLDCLACSPLWILCLNRRVVKKQLVKAVYHVFRIIYLAGQTVFCMLFNKSSFANTSLARHALMYLQAVNLVFWFSSFIDETVHIIKNQNKTEIIWHEVGKFKTCFANETVRFTQLQDCISRNNSITIAVHQYANPILRPFIIEYALLVGESLAHWFLSCGEKTPRGRKEEDESSRSGYSSITEGGSGGDDDGHDPQSTEENLGLLDSSRALNYRPMALVFHVGLAVLSNLLLCVFAFLPHLLNNAGDGSLDHDLYKGYYFYYCFHTLFVLLSVFVGYGISSRFKVKKHANFTGLDYMVIFTSAGPMAFNCFKLLATGAKNLPRTDLDLICVYR